MVVDLAEVYGGGAEGACDAVAGEAGGAGSGGVGGGAVGGEGEALALGGEVVVGGAGEAQA